MSYAPGHITHDTYIVLEADEAALILFRCEAREIVDQNMVHLIASEDMQGLARLRLKVIREMRELSPIQLPLYRFDNTVFWGKVTTTKRDDGLFESLIEYECEY